MLDTELQLELIKKALSNGGEYADLFVEHRRQTSLVLEDGKLEKIITGSDTGAGIRLIWNGRTSYAFSNDLTKEALMRAASEVSRAAAGGHAGSVIDLTVRKPGVTFDVKLCPADVPIEKKIAIVRAANSASREFDGRIKQVTAIYRDSVQNVCMASSAGFAAEDERIYTSAIIQVVAAHNNVIQTGYEPMGGFMGFELFEKNDIRELGRRAAARAVMMLTARKAPGGRMPVVISSSAGGTMIHEAIGHGLEADLAQQGLSVFSGKKGGRVASALVTVIDDSTLSQGRGSFRFDDEGTPSQRTVLVEKGVLINYMYDTLTAMKDKARSTANGRRESYRYRPIPRMTNTFIAAGETPPGEIVASLERGLFVQKMGGGQVNTVTGDFVFDVQEGYLIEKGLRGEPVRGATLTGNGPQILESIDMVGSDLGFSIGTCGKDSQGVPVSDAMPTVRVPEMVVGGTCGT
jgi:TldD protein